jgi:hypothetical protein
MPYTLSPFKPNYTYKSTTVEHANSFEVGGITWEAKPKITVNEVSNNNFRVGFIQVIKSMEFSVDYQRSIGTYKFGGGTPVCDCDPATDAPWYEPT